MGAGGQHKPVQGAAVARWSADARGAAEALSYTPCLRHEDPHAIESEGLDLR
jgi:hypothetical protein